MMEKKGVVILPNQLFEKHPALEKDAVMYLIEHPKYFSAYTFHKQKLIFHRASMKAYESFLKKKKYTVRYIEHKEAKKLWSIISKDNIEVLLMTDSVDHEIEKQFKKEAQKKKIPLEIYETPMFLTDLALIEKKYGKKKKFLMGGFYTWQRKRLKILVKNGKPVGGQWSFDKENREAYDDSVKIPTVRAPRKSKYVTAAERYVNKQWGKNYGETKKFIYPITHSAAKKWLTQFLSKRFKHFGTYQDAMVQDEPFMFHSLLSPLLNNGLLTPEFVVDKTLSYAKKHKIPINSLEGFIRQLIGWREFIRVVYHVVGQKEAKSNFFGNRKKLPKGFYTAKTKIDPIDEAILSIMEYAYAHHIERLMLLGNYMLLSNFHPKYVYQWFMELFIDAYEWVMIPNVYGMSQYADGGMMSTKPYIASSAYILRMSNYEKGDWCETWDTLFWAFMKKHISKLKKIPRMRFLINAYNKRKQ